MVVSKLNRKFVFRKLMLEPTKDQIPNIEFYSCLQLNISACDHTSENNQFVVTVYNPSSQYVNTFIRIPVVNQNYSVLDYNGLLDNN